MLTRITSFGPTCTLASSPEVGPGATIGTLKLGYPLLLYKDEEPTRLSLSRVVEVLCVGPNHGLPQTRAATQGPQQRPTPPHGQVRSRHMSREGDILQGINSKSGPPWESAGPPDIQSGPRDIQSGPPRLVPDLHVCKPDPWNGIWTPHMGSGSPTGESQGPRTEHTRALNRTQAGVRYRHVSRPNLVRTCLHAPLLPIQAETRCCHVAYCA
jgi:hypothetical protein